MSWSRFLPVTERPKDESPDQEPRHVHGLRGFLQVLPITNQVELRQTQADVSSGAAGGKSFIV